VVVTVAMTAAALVGATTGPAAAEADGTGGFVRCGPDTCVFAGARERPVGPVRAARSGRAPVRVAVTYEDCGPNFEVARVVAFVDVETGQRYEQSRICPAPVLDPADDPSVPPTAQEVWDELPLWAPTAALAPSCRGVVGRPSTTWASASPAVPAEVSLHGQTWSVTAEPVGWRVEVDVPDIEPPALAAADPGAPDRPLGELLPIRRGRSEVRVTETWTGSYTGPTGTFTLDYVDVTAVATTYRVVEIQAVIVGGGARADDPSVALACGE
jgi:hypothetical protein